MLAVVVPTEVRLSLPDAVPVRLSRSGNRLAVGHVLVAECRRAARKGDVPVSPANTPVSDRPVMLAVLVASSVLQLAVMLPVTPSAVMLAIVVAVVWVSV